MNTFSSTSLKVLLVGAFVVATAACVSSRPTRNGVFDENQYLRKNFLVHADDPGDPGWIMQGTIEQVSSPNPLAGAGAVRRAGSPQGLQLNITPPARHLRAHRPLCTPSAA